MIPDRGNTRLGDPYTFSSHPCLAHCNLVVWLHSTIRAVRGLAERNEAWAGRHILPFLTETFFVHKTNGENQWKQMAQGNGRKETDLPTTQRNDGQTRAGKTGLFSDFNWLCDRSDEEKAGDWIQGFYYLVQACALLRLAEIRQVFVLFSGFIYL